MKNPHDYPEEKQGTIAAALCFFLWGILPLYWKLLAHMNVQEMLAHRIFWSFVFMVFILLYKKNLGKALLLVKKPKVFFLLCCSGTILGGNWYIYMWAVNNDHVLSTSLGYFITPLLNILMGRLIFAEPASKLTWCAIFLAFFGVAFQIIFVGELPWVALALGGSFAIYGLFRKIILVEAMPALLIETLALLLPAVATIVWFNQTAEISFISSTTTTQLLLIGLGIITTVPLLFFAYAARRIPMTSLGLLQYIGPSCTFLLGIFIFKEPLHFTNLVTFVCIWVALALYVTDTIRTIKKKKQAFFVYKK